MELYSFITDRRRNPHPYEPERALEVIDDILARPGLEVLPVPVDVVARWTSLTRRHPVRGGKIFDIYLVATMLGNDVRRIYTFNRTDFEPFEEIAVLAP